MKRIFSLLFPLLLLAHFAGAQSQSLQLSLVLSPPYSPYFSDYLSFGNKALLTVVNTDAGATEVYFRGSITGNTGVSGATAGDFKPAVPITLKSGVSQLRGADFEEYFSLQHFDLKGITAGELTLGAGLPEGVYTICLQAFDFATDVPRSNDACVTVNIVYPEPPVLQLPLCDGGTVLGNKAQNVPFSWTMPPGAPPGTRYVLKMAQLYPGQNANDAIQALTMPPFFETEVPINTYIYRLSDPALMPGTQYAWQVQAFDPQKLKAFKNNGFSPVCSFTYTVPDLSPIASIKTPLNIISPVCLSGKSGRGKLSNLKNNEALEGLDQKLLYSSEQGTSIDWRWATQKDSVSIFTPLTSINGGDSLAYEVRIEPLQLMGDTKVPVKGNQADKSYTAFVKAPAQQLRLSAVDIEAAGLVSGHWYKVTITATGTKAGQPLHAGSATSCDFQLLRVGDSVRKTTISGQLAYRLEAGDAPHPAGGVSIAVRFSTSAKHTLPKINVPGKDAKLNAMHGVFATTDAEGKFSVSLPLEADAALMKYIDITVNNAYYQQSDTTYAIDIKAYDSSITKVVNGKTVTEAVPNGFKQSLNLGQRLLEVYTYDLTVKLTKGFPKFGFDPKKGYSAIDNTYDSLTINPNIKVKSGLPVMIYRLVKNTKVPRWEGDTLVPALEIAQPYKRLVVGRGTTSYQTIGSKEQTVVIFRRLLCSQSDNDVYYVQALLPTKSTAGTQNNSGSGNSGSQHAGGISANAGNTNPNFVNDWKNGYTEPPPSDYAVAQSQAAEDDFLAAPEQLVRFDIKKLKPGLIHDTMSVVYSLVSTKPPLSRLKGQLVYSWPSSPGVVRPLPNTKFSIKTQYLINGKKDAWMVAKNDCQKVTQQLHLTPDKAGSILDPSSGEVVIGAGKTDAEGYFDLLVLNYDKKGRISDSAVFDAVYLNFCKPNTGSPIDGKGLETDPILVTPMDKAEWVKSGITVNQIRELTTMANSSQYINDAGLAFNDLGNSKNTQTNTLLNGAGVTIAGSTGGLLSNTLAASMGAGLGNKAGKKAGMKGTQKGPAGPEEEADGSPDDKDQYLVDGASNVSVDRVLVMQIFSPWYGQPDKTIIVNAFETAELGKVPVLVNESGHTLTLKTTPANKVNTLSNAKVVVYREPGEKPEDLPQGEGSQKHPQKDLLLESMVSGVASGAKEWILEGGVAVDGNTASYKALALLENTMGAKYLTQIVPAPVGNATRFKQKLMEGLPGTASLTLLPGKIAGRVVEAAAPNPAIGGTKIVITKSGSEHVTLFADKDGSFEYEDNTPVGNNKIDWSDDGTTKLTLLLLKTGYASALINTTGPAYGMQQLQQVKLEPGAYIKFRTVGEQWYQVAGYALRGADSNAYTANYEGGKYFRVPAPSNAAVPIRIIPEDPGYFDTTFTVNTKNGELNVGDVKMVRRAHRMRFKVRRLDASGKEIPDNGYTDDDFQISINNGEHTGYVTPGKFCHFTFENVSVNNYALVLTDRNKRGYIPVALNLSNKESRDFTDYTLTIKKGGSFNGVVKLDGVPVKGAKVYIEQSSNGPAGDNTGFDAMTTLSGDGGAYTLSGIPLGGKAITLHATLEQPGKTIIGDAKTGTLGSSTLTIDLNLSSTTDVSLNSIWGYPITLEKLQKEGEEYVATGLINVSGGSKFKNLTGNGNMRFKEVRFKKRFNLPNTALDPKSETFALVETGVKMRYANRYNIALQGPDTKFVPVEFSKSGSGSSHQNMALPVPFQVRKGSDSYGVIDARARIVDNSYNYPSTYLNFEGTDDFWMGIDKAGGVVDNVIPALPAKAQPAWTPRLTNKAGGALAYHFIGFNATADPKKSYIDESGKIHLNTTFRGRVPGSDSIDINLPDLVLDGNKIMPYKGGNALNMKLESWTVEVKDWTVDPVKGGLWSKNALIHTGVADLKMSTFNLRKDLFVMDDFDATNINLGAITLENPAPGASVIYDQKVGSDARPHWRFNLVGQGSQPAGSFYLDEARKQRLDIDYMQLISYNNENLITLRKLDAPLHVLGNSRIDFYPQSVSSEPSTLFLDGPGHFDVPRTPDVNLRFAYKKVGNKLVENAEPMKAFSFTGKGNVVFTVTPNSQPIKGDKLLTYSGSVVEPDKFEPIPCNFSFGDNDPGTITYTGNKPLNLVGGTKLQLGSRYEGNILRNGMVVQDKDWTTLRFSGELLDPNKVMESGNIINFEVLGEIAANSKSIKASDIKTPFGNLNMVFDFPSKMMTGSMRMDAVEFGSYKFTGDVEVQFGAQGFLTLAAGQLNTGVLLAEGFGTFSSGLLLGSKSLSGADGPGIIKRTTQFSKSPKANCWLEAHKSNFKGFFFTGGYDILNTKKGLDIGIAACYFSAVLGIEASLGAYLGGPAEFKVGLGAHGLVKAGMSAITGTSISGQMEVHAGADATFVPKGTSFEIDGYADMGFGFTVKQSLLVETLEFDFYQTAGANFYLTNNKSPKADYDFFLSSVNENATCKSNSASK